jgi:transcriptional antiterminator RfaH
LNSEIPTNRQCPAPVWYLLQCKPRQEARAEENLQRQGYLSFHPQWRREVLSGGRRRLVHESLFPGYLFIQLHADSNWAPLRSTRGVIRLVGFNGQPLPVADSLIEALRWRVSAHNRQPELPVLQSGEKVRISDGPFAELEAVFHCMNGEQRAILLLNLLNRQQQVQLPLSSIRKL